MIYTTYFANLKNLSKNVIPISICAKAPSWYGGLQYKKLAPTYNILVKYKNDCDKGYYIKHYQKEVLEKVNPVEVIDDLLRLSNSTNIALVCYEKPTDFCHRHLVANWLNKNGFQTKEYVRGEL